MSAFCAGWYVIYTRPRHEKKVHSQLAEMEINSFLPLTKKLRTWHDRKKYIDEPLFPSYVFIYLNNMQNYYEGMNVDGALSYVRTGKNIARVNESVVRNIQLITNETQDIEVSGGLFHPGEQLIIREGPLTGLCCEVIEYDKKQRLLVRVELLRRNILIALPEDHLMHLC
jgi:transcription antitermination factor NusG